MRCAIAAVLVIGLGFGVYGCTQAQKAAAVQGGVDGGSGNPVNPPAGWDNFLVYLAAYLAGTTGKEALKAAKSKYMKA